MRFFAIGLPMMPRPMNAIFISKILLNYAILSFSLFESGGKAIYSSPMSTRTFFRRARCSSFSG